MFSTLCRSSVHTPPGRHISLRLQLEHVTSNLRAPLGISVGFMKMALGLGCLNATTAMALASSHWIGCGALRDHVADAFELAALVEKIACAELAGEAPVGLGGEIGKHVEVDPRRLGVTRA